MNLKSKYVRFAYAYCDAKGYVTIDKEAKRKIYEPEDVFEGILLLWDYENRNRRKQKV